AIIYTTFGLLLSSMLLTFSIFIQLIGLPNITPYIPLIYGLWTDLGLIVGLISEHFADIDEKPIENYQKVICFRESVFSEPETCSRICFLKWTTIFYFLAAAAGPNTAAG
ncbi:hypothetical protein ACJX0J_007767, partial [Zea mays]